MQPFSLTPPDTLTNRLLCCHPFSSDTSCSSVHAIRTALSFIAFGKYSPYSIAKVIYSRLIPSCSFMHGYTNQYKTGCLSSQAAPLLQQMLFFTQLNNILCRRLYAVRNKLYRQPLLQHSYYYFLLFLCTAFRKTFCEAFCNTFLPLPL